MNNAKAIERHFIMKSITFIRFNPTTAPIVKSIKVSTKLPNLYCVLMIINKIISVQITPPR